MKNEQKNSPIPCLTCAIVRVSGQLKLCKANPNLMWKKYQGKSGEKGPLFALRRKGSPPLCPQEKRIPPFAGRRKGSLLCSQEKRVPPLVSGEKDPPFALRRKGYPLCSQEKGIPPLLSGEKGPPFALRRKGSPLWSQEKRVPPLVSGEKKSRA